MVVRVLGPLPPTAAVQMQLLALAWPNSSHYSYVGEWISRLKPSFSFYNSWYVYLCVCVWERAGLSFKLDQSLRMVRRAGWSWRPWEVLLTSCSVRSSAFVNAILRGIIEVWSSAPPISRNPPALLPAITFSQLPCEISETCSPPTLPCNSCFYLRVDSKCSILFPSTVMTCICTTVSSLLRLHVVFVCGLK